MVKTVPAVEKGDPVAIIVKKGRISVSVVGIAREQGEIGEKIWVQNSKTNKLIRVKIKGKGIVTVLQGGVSI
jgi:flagella basal body P-ring formation protein FlgA